VIFVNDESAPSERQCDETLREQHGRQRGEEAILRRAGTVGMLDRLEPSYITTYLRNDNPEAGIALTLALSTVQSYLTEAAVQQRRVVRQQKAIRDYLRQVTSDFSVDEDRPVPRPLRPQTESTSVGSFLPNLLADDR
jgi:hypothetical protein